MPSAESYEAAGFRSGLPVSEGVHVHAFAESLCLVDGDLVSLPFLFESVEQASRDWRHGPAMVEVRARRGMRS